MYEIAAILFVLSVLLFIFDYYIFHYLEQSLRFGKEFHRKPEKPFLAFLVGMLAVDLLAASIVFLLCGLFLRS